MHSIGASWQNNAKVHGIKYSMRGIIKIQNNANKHRIKYSMRDIMAENRKKCQPAKDKV